MTVNQFIKMIKSQKRNGKMTGNEVICSLVRHPDEGIECISPSVDAFVDTRMGTFVFSHFELTEEVQKSLAE